ncbi:MAG: hypothetical protein ACI4IQ_04195, partial [Eubacterium sp.]
MKIKRILSLLLSVVMLLSITAGLDFSAEASSYSSNYKRWSQNKSDYSWMQNYGCAVVAEAKMIYEAGIKTSSFNPDVYYKWCLDKGYVNSSGFVYADNPVKYAKALGNTALSYLGNTTSNCTDKIKSNANNGYYSIICVGNHYVMVDNAKTKSTGTVYVYDSFGIQYTTNAPGKDSYTLSERGYSVKSVRSFKYTKTSSITKPSVTVKAVSNLTTNSAQINFTCNNPSKVTIKTVGVQVRKKGVSNWTSKSEAMNPSYVNAASTPMWWTVGSGKELNMSLNAGTIYEYRAYVVYNGTNYYSSISTFTTKGPHTHSYSSGVITKSSTCSLTGIRRYTCTNCGGTKTETIPATGHSYNSGVITKNPTCTSTGVKTYTCIICGDTKTLAIAKTEHSYITTTTKATTSSNGFIVTKCTACSEVKSWSTIYYPKTVTLSKTSYVYDGKVKKPTVTVKDSKGNKIASSNYTVTYSSGCKNVGTYTVT